MSPETGQPKVMAPLANPLRPGWAHNHPAALNSSSAFLDVTLLLLLFGLTILAIHGLGFVSDDFFLLIGNLKLPLTQSSDELHRPLRNIVLKFAGSLLGVKRVWPYRVLVAGSFVAVLAVLYQLTRRLGAGRSGARAAALLVAFCPRNQEVLFWFAAWQDLVAAVCVLLAALFFIDFRESKRTRRLMAAATAYLVALGFKETTVVIPFLLLLLDIYRERSLLSFRKPAFWRAYLPFASVLLLYVVYYLSDSGAASLTGHKTGGYYGFHGLFGVVTGVIRALVNLALPFTLPLPLGLADVRLRHVAMLVIEVVLLLLFVWRLKAWPAFTLSMGWVILTILPTAAFAAAFNADRYLFVPLTGVALMLGLTVDELVRSRPDARYSALVWLALANYCVAGGLFLAQYRSVWQKGGEEAALVARRTVTLASRLPRGSEIDLVNLTLFLYPYRVSVFTNGLADALAANGLPSSIHVLRNFAEETPEQQILMMKLQACTDSTADDSGKRVILVTVNHRLVQVRPGCAAPLIDADRADHPTAWGFLNASR